MDSLPKMIATYRVFRVQEPNELHEAEQGRVGNNLAVMNTKLLADCIQAEIERE